MSCSLPKKPIYTPYSFRELKLENKYDNLKFVNGKAQEIGGGYWEQKYSLHLSSDTRWVLLSYMGNMYKFYRVHDISHKPINSKTPICQKMIKEYRNRVDHIKYLIKENEKTFKTIKAHREFLSLFAPLIIHVQDNVDLYKYFEFDDTVCNDVLQSIKEHLKR